MSHGLVGSIDGQHVLKIQFAKYAQGVDQHLGFGFIFMGFLLRIPYRASIQTHGMRPYPVLGMQDGLGHKSRLN